MKTVIYTKLDGTEVPALILHEDDDSAVLYVLDHTTNSAYFERSATHGDKKQPNTYHSQNERAVKADESKAETKASK
jgi:hypothetical protein